MGILMPLTIPLAWAIVPEQGYVLMNVGAVLTGAIFGDHCSPISDTTILSSMGSACDHIDHTRTQMVYAVTVGAATILFGYIPVGLGLPVTVVLPGAMVVVAAMVYLFGKRVEE
jgi:Na+/H+ antiporter NhaC